MRWPLEQPALASVRISVDYPEKPRVLRELSFEIRQGEILGLVGQSGSGKSTLALALLGLLEFRRGKVSGEIWFEGRDLLHASERELRRIRGSKMALVPQSPLSALNPALRLGTQLDEAFQAHRAAPRRLRRRYILDTLGQVTLPAEEDFLRRYPEQLSVGQAQRVLIAMAILHRPALLVADEPTSALDVITQAEILQLFARLNRELGTTILYISHDLLSIAGLCGRIGILQEGRLVEVGATEQIFGRPAHPYTRSLIDAMPARPRPSGASSSACDKSPQTKLYVLSAPPR